MERMVPSFGASVAVMVIPPSALVFDLVGSCVNKSSLLQAVIANASAAMLKNFIVFFIVLLFFKGSTC